MQAIPIPPVHHVAEIMDEESMHLVLAHVYRQNNAYASYYRALALSKKSPYVILDNGAYELGCSIEPSDLFEVARSIHASEVAMPDVLRDRIGTQNATARGLKVFEMQCSEFNIPSPNIMLIPQGRTPGEWAFCLFKLVDMFMSRYHYTTPFFKSSLIIGVPKWTNEFKGGRYDLIANYVTHVVSDLGSLFVHVPTYVHCLGWESDLWEIGRIARDFPWVRSTDSAKPFRFAANNVNIHLEESPPAYKHGADYFDWKLEDVQILRARTNMNVYRMAASGITREYTGVTYAAS